MRRRRGRGITNFREATTDPARIAYYPPRLIEAASAPIFGVGVKSKIITEGQDECAVGEGQDFSKFHEPITESMHIEDDTPRLIEAAATPILGVDSDREATSETDTEPSPWNPAIVCPEAWHSHVKDLIADVERRREALCR